jgi:hypothetical protein
MSHPSVKQMDCYHKVFISDARILAFDEQNLALAEDCLQVVVARLGH